jgi:hypothetical protein
MFIFTFEGVGTAQLVYRLDGLGSIPSSQIFFSSPQRSDRLWGPPSLLSNGNKLAGA